MIRSENLDALNAALSAAQGEFEAVSKTADNPFFKSKYAALPDVVKAATPILNNHGLAVWQGGDTDEQGELLWTVVLHQSGQYIGSAARMLPVKNDSQAQGSAITYQRRYQYMAALGLVADVDDDGNAATAGRNRASAPKPPSRGRTSTQRNVPTPTPDGHSEAEHGSHDDGDAPALVSTETLEKLVKAHKDAGLTVPQLKAICKEAGADGRKINELTEDQAAWVIIALNKRAKPTEAAS